MDTKKIMADEFFAKIESLKEKNGADLSTAEDLSLAVMNLISLEEHFFFTALKTGKDGYFDASQEIRSVRKELLAKLMPENEGETWCISKHLLAASMRLMEVGNKLRSENKNDEAKKMFGKAYKIYSVFWALKLKLISGKKTDQQSVGSTSLTAGNSRLEELVNKLADCCDE